MEHTKNYHTKQREAVLACVLSFDSVHVTAAEIIDFFKENEKPIGRSTIFRHLDKLTADGTIRRYTVDGIAGACYQYIGDKENCRAHLHLKCEVCGALQHLECETLDEIKQNVLNKHSFEVDALKTVLYGICTDCKHEHKNC